MDKIIDQLINFLADYDVDVYDATEIGRNKVRLNLYVYKRDSELAARLALVKGLKGYNQKADRKIKVVSQKIVEKGDNEIEIELVLQFDEPNEIHDSVQVAERPKELRNSLEFGNTELVAVSDYSGKIIDPEDVWGTSDAIMTRDEAIADLFDLCDPISHEDLEDEFKSSERYDPKKQYYHCEKWYPDYCFTKEEFFENDDYFLYEMGFDLGYTKLDDGDILNRYDGEIDWEEHPYVQSDFI